VFDLDNTLMQPKGNYGSDQWYYYLVRDLRVRGRLSSREAEQQAMTIWNRVQAGLRMRSVEPDTARSCVPSSVAAFITIGLTARTPDIADTTLRQLRGVGVDLARRTVPAREMAWRAKEDVRFKRGVLFVGEGTRREKP
jgi:hypothetical protein